MGQTIRSSRISKCPPAEPAARSELPSVPRCKDKRYDCQGRHQANLYIGQAVEFVMVCIIMRVTSFRNAIHS